MTDEPLEGVAAEWEDTVSRSVQYLDAPWPDGKMAGYEGPGWYYWDETWAYCHGPYKTREATVLALADYCEHLEGES